jgi:hypothetical protein
MADELDAAILQNAQGPAKAASESGSVVQHPLKDQIEADRYLAGKQAAKRGTRGLRITKLILPGQTGNDRGGEGVV